MGLWMMFHHHHLLRLARTRRGGGGIECHGSLGRCGRRNGDGANDPHHCERLCLAICDDD